jgi:hypothetical protein
VQSLLLNGPGGERAAADASASQNVASQQLVDAVTSRQLQQRLEQLLPQAAYTIPQVSTTWECCVLLQDPAACGLLFINRDPLYLMPMCHLRLKPGIDAPLLVYA